MFHVLNRGVGRMNLFKKAGDFGAFERYVEKTLESCPMRICAYCLLPNHFHMVLWPEHDGDLGGFMQKLTVTHVRNWQEHRQRVGYGHVYQGRYKSFPVETDDYFYQVVRYVERVGECLLAGTMTLLLVGIIGFVPLNLLLRPCRGRWRKDSAWPLVPVCWAVPSAISRRPAGCCTS